MIDLGRNPVLVIIDVQKAWDGLFPGKWSSEDAVSNISKLLGKWRSEGWKVIHVRHDSRKPQSIIKEGKPGFAFKDEVKPIEGEAVITKHVNSAFIGTNLEEMLRNEGPSTVVICGLVTDHCVSTTARMSGNLGFNTVVPGDGCATYPKKTPQGREIDALTVHEVNLASINGEFANVVPVSDLL
ncbi:hypothetical protein IX51_05090 [uncultured archaeon]|nr:hypothetical protein IX51_05090 [uncultured archaeon]